MTKTIKIAGHSGNTRRVEIVVAGDCWAEKTPKAVNEDQVREAVRTLYNVLPGYAWAALVDQVEKIKALR